MEFLNYADIAKRMQKRREFLGYSLQELADKTGMSKSTLQRYETGSIKNIPIARLKALSEALEYDVNSLVGISGQDNTASLTFAGHRVGRAYEKATPPVQRTVEVALDPFMEEDDPLDNIIKVDFSKSERRASAGTGIYLDDESMITVKARLDSLPSDYQRYPDRYFGVPVGGDSMEPTYHDGDLLIVCKEPVNVGEIGVFTMDGEGYVKELGRGVLHSLNPDYDDIPLVEDVRCNGKVVGVLDPEDVFEE